MPAASVNNIVEAFQRQATFCRDLHNAHLTAAVIDAARADIETGGPIARFVENFGEDPWKDALALRVAGALHYLVIKDYAPGLQPFYHGDAKAPRPAELQKLVSRLAGAHEATFRRYIAKPPQTNEIKRAAALLPGFSLIARETGLPLNLYELGSSGGLLLAFDKFRIDYGSATWGSGEASLKSSWCGDPPDLTAPIEIAGRFGCDRNPIDLTDADQLVMMHSYIWPEQIARHELFDAAVKKRLDAGVVVEKAEALDWAGEKLSRREAGRTMVVFHSVFAVYLDKNQRHDLDQMLEQAGANATADSPLARLSFEPVEAGDSLCFFVKVRIWPGGVERTIAKAHAHGEWVEPTGD